MTRDELNDAYFEWMCRLVGSQMYRNRSYRRLLSHMHTVAFRAMLSMDENRASDGIDLRYRFGDEQAIDTCMISAYLDDRPCSVMEMMVALAHRCEEQIMDDPEIGDRTGTWFWVMIDNLGLREMSDGQYDRAQVERVLQKFMNRQYKRNGKGGLFSVERSCRDFREAEIWNQMNWYLNSIL